MRDRSAEMVGIFDGYAYQVRPRYQVCLTACIQRCLEAILNNNARQKSSTALLDWNACLASTPPLVSVVHVHKRAADKF